MDTILVPLPENYEVINFSQLKISDVISQAIEDAESFMSNGEYQRAFDRVHTAFHGYLIEILKNMKLQFLETKIYLNYIVGYNN